MLVRRAFVIQTSDLQTSSDVRRVLVPYVEHVFWDSCAIALYLTDIRRFLLSLMIMGGHVGCDRCGREHMAVLDLWLLLINSLIGIYNHHLRRVLR